MEGPSLRPRKSQDEENPKEKGKQGEGKRDNQEEEEQEKPPGCGKAGTYGSAGRWGIASPRGPMEGPSLRPRKSQDEENPKEKGKQGKGKRENQEPPQGTERVSNATSHSDSNIATAEGDANQQHSTVLAGGRGGAVFYQRGGSRSGRGTKPEGRATRANGRQDDYMQQLCAIMAKAMAKHSTGKSVNFNKLMEDFVKITPTQKTRTQERKERRADKQHSDLDEAVKKLRCPVGHKLHIHQESEGGNRYCDTCDVVIKQGMMCGSCDKCQYDICVACGRQELQGKGRSEVGSRPEKFEGKCFCCGKTGHRQSECWHSKDAVTPDRKGAQTKGGTWLNGEEQRHAAQHKANNGKGEQGNRGNNGGKGPQLTAWGTPAVGGKAAWRIREEDFTAVTMTCQRFQEELEE